jgi:hypothetical protein
MIESIPAESVLAAAELERQMIKEDMAHKRTLPIQDAVSILSFCHFLKAVKLGTDIPPGFLPVEHVPFYRNTVERLIVSEELPFGAKEQFDAAFSANFFKALTA